MGAGVQLSWRRNFARRLNQFEILPSLNWFFDGDDHKFENGEHQIMNNENRDVMAHSGSAVLTGMEAVETIEELLRKRGFFDTAETEEQG